MKKILLANYDEQNKFSDKIHDFVFDTIGKVIFIISKDVNGGVGVL